jgi:alpha-L-arabinofuranosidase
MANLAQLVNVIAPMITTPEDLLLQTTFYPFELYSRTAGSVALDVGWSGETYSAGDYAGVRRLDVSATLDEERRELVVYVVNRGLDGPAEVEVRFDDVRPTQDVEVHTISGPDPGAVNTFDDQARVSTSRRTQPFGTGHAFTATLPSHSVTGLVFTL